MSRSRFLAPTLVTVALLAACSSGSSDSGDGNAQPSPSPSSGPTIGTGASSPISAQPVSAQLKLQLSTSQASTVAPSTVAPLTNTSATPSYNQVAGIFQSNCLSCHGGRTEPNLSSFPFQGGGGLDHVMMEIKQRINDPMRPMPPSGQINSSDLAKLNSWIDAGYPNSPMGPGAQPSPASAPSNAPQQDYSRYTVYVKWTTVNGIQSNGWQRLWGVTSGAYTLPLGMLTTGDTVTTTVQVSDAAGNVVVSKTLAPVAVPASGMVQVAVPVR